MSRLEFLFQLCRYVYGIVLYSLQVHLFSKSNETLVAVRRWCQTITGNCPEHQPSIVLPGVVHLAPENDYYLMTVISYKSQLQIIEASPSEYHTFLSRV